MLPDIDYGSFSSARFQSTIVLIRLFKQFQMHKFIIFFGTNKIQGLEEKFKID